MLGFSAMANAAIRNVYSFLAGMGFLFALLGIDAATQDRIMAAVHQIGDGAILIIGGVSTIVPILTAVYARWTAKPAQQVAAVQALPNVQAIVAADPDRPLTAGAPGARVMSHWLIGLLALILLPLLGGCSKEDLEALRKSPESQVALIDATYAAAKALIPPPCSATIETLCLDPAAEPGVEKDLAVADIAVAAGKQLILTANADAGTISKGVTIALNAVAALRQALAVYGIKAK